MSAQSDIKALQKLKNDMLEANAYADLAKEEWDKCNEYKAELENTKFVFKPLPTNNYETTKANYKAAWKEFFSNTRKFRIAFLSLYSLAMVAIAVLLFIGAFKNNGFIFNSPHQWNETVQKVLTSLSAAAFPLIVGACSWITIVPFEDAIDYVKTILISLGVSAVFFGAVCIWTNSMPLLFIILGSLPAAMLVSFIVHLIFLIISKIHILTPGKRANLVAQKQKDIENAKEHAE